MRSTNDVVLPGLSHEDPTTAVEHFVDLTQHEIQALRTRHNLADAHTHQRQSAGQQAIVQRLPDLWTEAEEKQQAFFENRFLDLFFELHGQPTARGLGRTMLSYSASVSTMVAAMFLKQRGMSTALIEPCFDNLTDLLRNFQVPLQPLPEDLLADPATIYQRLSEHVTTDALYLVDPNNPTGFTLLRHGRTGFEEVVRYCVDHGKLLMLDFCFASFALCDANLGRFDVYELLENSGVTYMALEDTGKTWPIQDAKCAALTVSRDIAPEVWNNHTSVLLNVSPFVLNVVGHYVQDAIADNMASVRDVISTNRAVLREALAGTVLELITPAVETSVAWTRITPPELTATELQRHLLGADVYVLSGTYFYWSEPERGERNLRMALARDPGMFAAAAERMRAELLRHG